MKLKEYKQGDIISDWELLTPQQDSKYILWECRHICGEIKSIYLHNLTKGRLCVCNRHTSCDGDSSYSKVRLYRIYTGMLSRCNNPNREKYPRYGGRGIKVLFKDYIDFKQWSLTNGYREDLTIERINNDGHYEPSNCTWIPAVEQSKNTSCIKYSNDLKAEMLKEVITRKAEYGSKKQIAKKYNIPYGTMLHLLVKYRKQGVL